MIFVGAQLALELRAPPVEEVLRFRGEPEEGEVFRRQLLRAHGGRLERVQSLEDVDHTRSGGGIRPAIHVLPGAHAVGPDSELKPLEQPITPRPPNTSRKYRS